MIGEQLHVIREAAPDAVQHDDVRRLDSARGSQQLPTPPVCRVAQGACSSTSQMPTAGSMPSLRYPCGVAESNDTASPGPSRCSSKPRVTTSSPLTTYPYSMPGWRISNPRPADVPPGS